ncbi:MAG: MFS transporter [Neisseriaceae bacterium]|nr:MFS transporter [Neisseriaceae bacterium]
MSIANVPDASWRALLSGRNGLRSIALAGGVALHAINVYIVVTILPSIIADIGGLAYYAWSTTLFVVTSIVGSTLAAKLIDRLGPRWAYLLGLGVFSTGTLLCALAPSMPLLLLGRSVQGLGGGILMALSYALIRLLFASHLWARGMALVSGMWGIATLCGPAVGGLFAQGGHWRWAFLFLLPVALLLAVIVMKELSPTPVRSPEPIRIPALTIGLLVASVLVVSVASLSPDFKWQLLGIVMGLLILVGVGKRDTRARVKLLPSGAYTLSAELGVVYAMMCLLVASITPEIFVPYFLQLIHGFSPLSAGYLTAAMAAGWTVGSVYSAGKQGPVVTAMLRLGPLVILVALVSLAWMTPQQGWLAPWPRLVIYCVALAGVGLGIGMGWPHLLTHVLNSAPQGQEALASASISTIQLYATAFAAALAGVVANGSGLTQPGGLEGAKTAAQWVFALFALAPLLAFVLVRRLRGLTP